MAVPPRVAQEDADGVLVVRFLDRMLMDDRGVREAGDQLSAALPTTGPIRLIIDFNGVKMISSAMIGRLVMILRRVDGSGGMLRLCELSPAVSDVLRTTNLDRVLIACRDRREAREAFGA